MADSSSSFFNSKLRHEATAVVKTIINMLVNLTLWFYQTPYYLSFFALWLLKVEHWWNLDSANKFDNDENESHRNQETFFHLTNLFIFPTAQERFS